jgi:beta-glucanase (GH16 family)
VNSSFQLAGEINYKQANLYYVSVRVLARVSGAPGAVAGFFTYYDDNNESDIEILTRDPASNIHLSNQPTTDAKGAAIAGATLNESIPASRMWTDWNVYRLDWLPGRSAWFVNGLQAASSSINVPATPSSFNVNMWSNAGSWPGAMAVGAQAVLQVQWIEMAFNVSGYSDGGNSGDRAVVCSVDKLAGSPVMSEGQRRTTGFPWCLLFIFIISTVWMTCT